MCILFLYHSLKHPDDTLAEKLDLNYRPEVHKASGRGRGQGQGIGGRYKLIVASNRDEYMDRSTVGMHFWEDGGSNVLAGRDLQKGGTWLGVSRCGKFASVTNVPSSWAVVMEALEANVNAAALGSVAMMTVAVALPILRRQLLASSTAAASPSFLSAAAGLLCFGLGLVSSVGFASLRKKAKNPSRGQLVANFLKGTDENAEQYCKRLFKERGRYDGFNIVLADASGAWSLSNRDAAGVTRLPRGFYGVSNATLDVPWPKVIHGKSRVMDVLLRCDSDPKFTEDALVDQLMDVLADERMCSPEMGNTYLNLCIATTNGLAFFQSCYGGVSNEERSTCHTGTARRIALFHSLRRGVAATHPTALWPNVMSEESFLDTLNHLIISSGHPPSCSWSDNRVGRQGWKRQLERVCVPPTRVSSSWFSRRDERYYSTRSSTVVLVDASGRMKVVERNLGDWIADPISMQSASRNTFEFCDI